MTKDALAVAIEALSWMGYTGIGERTALLKSARQLQVVSGVDLRQAHKWIMETNRFQNRLDWYIDQVTSDDTTKAAPHGIRSLFRILAYMHWVSQAPKAETERVAAWGRQIIGWRELHPYEESIARLVCSNKNPSAIQVPEFERLAIETCHSPWYVQRLTNVFGRDHALKLLRRDLHPVSSFARVNPLNSESGASVSEKLNGTKVKKLEGTYVLQQHARDDRAKLASLGQIVIQDLGSIVAGLVASPRPGQVVLDICAAPGNKTSHMAAQMSNEGEIYSVELSGTRSAQWRKEMGRTGCRIAHLIRADARKLPFNTEADVTLVDPPCSNSGVFARNPANKWRINPTRLIELSRMQNDILQAASKMVSKDGSLIYCTCSILPEENEYIVEAFLRRSAEFTLIPQTPNIGSPGLRGLTDCQRFYPTIHDCNGSFIAKMRRE